MTVTIVESAAEAATTDWRTYDGDVVPALRFRVIFLPILLAATLVLPALLCYICLARGRIVPYVPPNYNGGFDYEKTSRYNKPVTHGAVAKR
ncbi:unnamed protein product [Discula destructiva]